MSWSAVRFAVRLVRGKSYLFGDTATNAQNNETRNASNAPVPIILISRKPKYAGASLNASRPKNAPSKAVESVMICRAAFSSVSRELLSISSNNFSNRSSCVDKGEEDTMISSFDFAMFFSSFKKGMGNFDFESLSAFFASDNQLFVPPQRRDRYYPCKSSRRLFSTQPGHSDSYACILSSYIQQRQTVAYFNSPVQEYSQYRGEQ